MKSSASSGSPPAAAAAVAAALKPFRMDRLLRMNHAFCACAVAMVSILLLLPNMAQGIYLGPKLSHLVVDNSTGVVYVGGENRLYQLTSDLEMLMELKTGPKNDSIRCFPPPTPCFVNKTLTNNYNKVLLVDPKRRKLITCGSVYQGQCHMRSLTNISISHSSPEKQEMRNWAVAANNEEASTVAFIAPGPPSLMGTVMYVATTYTGVPEQSNFYRNQVPAIATRSLHRDNRFALAEVTNNFQEKWSALYLKNDVAPNFPIKYVYGFASDTFSYFMTVQRDRMESINKAKVVTKIIQICQQDSFFYSYADIPLKCVGKNGADYNILEAAMVVKPGEQMDGKVNFHDKPYPGDLLLGLFSRKDRSATDSAMCLYSMTTIRDKFLENIKLCHQGNTTVSGGGYLSVGPKGNCQLMSGLFKSQVEDDRQFLCNSHKLETFSNVVGTSPAVEQALFEYQGLKMTAVLATVVNQKLVAFVGTANGHLKKFAIAENKTESKEYADLVVSPGEPVAQEMSFDATKEHIYILTGTNVTKLPVQTCRQWKYCNECLADGDPHCGWCSLENKCDLHQNCYKPKSASSFRWLHGSTSDCIVITTVSPASASVSESTELLLTIPNLGSDSHYTCVFMELGWTLPTIPWFFGVKCMTPDFSKHGLSLGKASSKVITLALNSTETGKIFVSKSYPFYNCSNFRSCSSCVSSDFQCDWCIYNNACYDNTTSCKNDINKSVVRGIKSQKPGLSGVQHCPKIDAESTGSIYLTVGLKKTILLRGYNIPEIVGNQRAYQCVLKAGKQTIETLAKRHDDESLACDIPPLSYVEKTGTLPAELSVYWDNKFLLESTSKLFATIYKCDILANSECSLCLNLNYTRPYLECQWCGNQCMHTSKCKAYPSFKCPAPRIDSVWPLSGPTNGGTNITIRGSNLGSKFDDIKKGIKVASVGCEPYEDLYSPSKTIVCKTQWRGTAAHGKVIVQAKHGRAEFHKDFYFKVPRLERIYPTSGPKSGGSRITIHGRDLDIGGHVTVTLEKVPCTVDRSSIKNTSIVCVTSKVWSADAKSTLHVFFDGREYRLDTYFIYKEDPIIDRIYPLSSILEGGRILTVTGKEFSYIQQPKLFAHVPTIGGFFYPTNFTNCTVMNNEVMKCPSPPLVQSLKNIIRSRRATSQKHKIHPVKTVQLGFIMDGVKSVQNLSAVPNLDNRLKYYPNPTVFNFTETDAVKLLKGDALIIEGANLNVAAEKSDVSVTIGSSSCNVTTFSRTQIVCKLRTAKPGDPASPLVGIDDGLPLVKVKINSLEVVIGKVELDIPETYSFPTEAIAGIIAGGSFLLIIIVIILIIYRSQSTKAERIYRKLQIQLDNLESNVRNECKQAFAELQTDMTDLTGDLVSSGIPFWDFHSYVFKVLFPGMTDHIILHPPIQKNGRFQFSDHGLQLFHQLLNKKIFMVTFIRTLEEQRAFSIRDRANVASLLMIVYLNNMEYATEILKCLLVDLVRKSVDGRHPKLMLRRSESVVEKLLTNWLSICLYKYLRDCAGASLFMLYKAIKLQAGKGPVDAVTGDARYSLSEDTLLREKIEPKILTLNIESGGEIVQCRIPDCDTITQAKEKILDHIYRNIPFSHRPHVRDLELEWRNGPTGPLTLMDTDIASQNKDGWRRLNTLAFYRVHDGSYLSLLHRQQTMKSLNGSLDNSVLSIGSVSPILKKDQESGCKEWHLVKHDDSFVKDGGVKMISEIFLTRLLSTKGTLQKYVDDFFKNILGGSSYVPPVVKFLFDFLDQQALIHGITDYEVVHTWKCNSLPLRFWVNIIKNPEFVFDVHKPRIVDSCLSVVAQTFMDSCSIAEHRLGKDSPSNKLLFAKDIVHYRKLVEKYFTDISNMPSLTDQDMNVFLADISRTSPKLFYISSALGELYKYVSKYKNELMEALEQDNQANALQLSCKLGHVVSCMEGPSGSMAYV